jgi:Fuc2NAc and GlcNAc transferase
MNGMVHWLLAAGLTLLLAWVGTGLFRRYALKALMDVPNARSSHKVATPRGGGVAIVGTLLLALLLMALCGVVELRLAMALGVAGSGVALLGFWDDHGHIAARWRLLGHLAAGAWVLAWVPALPAIELLGWQPPRGLLLPLLLLFVAWMLNLFNFMDGIDGIAASQAVAISLGAAALWAWLVPVGNWPVALLFGMSVLGFLLWNWPPAKIFMGDVGSGFLGFMVAALALWSGQQQVELFWVWVILSAPLASDATATLLRRLLRGEAVYEAHRSHAYQWQARRVGRHLPVTLAYLAATVLWCLPLAAGVAFAWLPTVAGVLLAYIPMLLAVVGLKAGMAES